MGNSESQPNEVEKTVITEVFQLLSNPYRGKDEDVVLNQSIRRPDHYNTRIETEKPLRVSADNAQRTEKVKRQDDKTVKKIPNDPMFATHDEMKIRYRGTVKAPFGNGMSKFPPCSAGHTALYKGGGRPKLLPSGKKNTSNEADESGKSKSHNADEPASKPSDKKQITLAASFDNHQKNGPKSDLVPCDFCTALFNVANIALHQSRCRADLLRDGRGTTSGKAAESASTSCNTREPVHPPSSEMRTSSAVENKLRQELAVNITLHRAACEKNLPHKEQNISTKPDEIDVAKSNSSEARKNDELKYITRAESIGKRVMEQKYYALSLQPSKHTSDTSSLESKCFKIDWIPASGNTVADKMNFQDERKMDTITVANASGQVKSSTEYNDYQRSEAPTSTEDYASDPSDCDSKPTDLNKDRHASRNDVSTKSLSNKKTKDVLESDWNDCPKVLCGSCFKPISPYDMQEHESGCFKHSSNFPESSELTKHSNCSESHEGTSVKPEDSSTPPILNLQNVKNSSNDLNSPVDIGLADLHIPQDKKVCGICSNTFDCTIFSEHESVCNQKFSSPSISEPQQKIDSKNPPEDQPADGRKTKEPVIIQGVSYELKLDGKYENKVKKFQSSEHIAEQYGMFAGKQCSKLDSKESSDPEVWRAGCVNEQSALPNYKKSIKMADECEASVDKCNKNESKHINYDENISLIPCEFCSRLFYDDFIVEHQSGCRPDLVHFFVDCKPDATSDPSDSSKAVELNAQAQKLCHQAETCNYAEDSEAVVGENLEHLDQRGELKNAQYSKTKLEFFECEANRNEAFEAMPRFTNESKKKKHKTWNLVPCKFCSRLFYINYITEHQSSCELNSVHCQPEPTFSDRWNNIADPAQTYVHNVKPQDVIDFEAKIKETSENVDQSSPSSGQRNLETGYLETSEGKQDRSSAVVQCSWTELTVIGKQMSPVSVGAQCSGEDLTPIEVCPVSLGVQCSGEDLTPIEVCPVSVGVQCSEGDLTPIEVSPVAMGVQCSASDFECESALSECESAPPEFMTDNSLGVQSSEICSSAASIQRMECTPLDTGKTPAFPSTRKRLEIIVLVLCFIYSLLYISVEYIHNTFVI